MLDSDGCSLRSKEYSTKGVIMFDLNKEKCIKCGKCARVCPFTCITMENIYPEMAPKKVKACVKCLHCAAICPTEALTFAGMPCENLPPLKSGEELFRQTKELIQTRRSKRHFTKEMVPVALIEELIRTTDFSPTARNQQPQSWLVLHNPEIVAKLMELVVEWVGNKHIAMEILSELENGNNIVTLGAPHLILGCGPKEGKLNPTTDITIALRDLDLLMHAKGLGVCWAGYLSKIVNSSLEIRALLGIPSDMVVYGALAFGYPDQENYLRLPYRGKTKIRWK